MPGVIITKRTNNIVRSLYKETNISKAVKIYSNENINATPLGRLCTTEDVSKLTATFLCSKEADFITGKSITLDGGKNTD